MFIKLLCGLVLVITSSTSNLLPVSFENDDSISSCAVNVAENYFVETPNMNFFSINATRDGVILLKLYQLVQGKKIRDFQTFEVDFYETFTQYSVIVADSLNELITFREKFQKLNLWNARSKFLFIIRKNSIGKLKHAVDFLWHFFIINAIILMPSEEDETVIEVFSWYPYENGLCGENVIPYLIDLCLNGTFLNNTNLYPVKVPQYLNGCPVRAQVIIEPPFVMPPDDGIVKDDEELPITNGIEILLMRTIAQIANFSLKTFTSTVSHDWGLGTLDGNVTGTIKVLFERRADIGFGTYGPTAERRMFCDHSASHTFEGITWCVPKAQFAPRWRNLLDTFQYSTWLSMMGAYLIISVLTWAFCSLPPRDVTPYVKLQNNLNNYFSIFIAVSVNNTPKKAAGRILFFVWMIFGLHFVAAYQAKLIYKLLNPMYEKQLSTLEEILTSGMDWASLPTLKRFYANTDDWRVAKVIRDWKPCDDEDACLERIAYKRDFALCILHEHVKYELLKYTDSNALPLIHCFPFYLQYASEMYMTKGYPLRDRIDKLIYRVKATGLMAKWQKDMAYLRTLKNRNKLDSETNEQNLTVSHLQGAFIILGLGYCASVAVFIGENIYGFIRKRASRKKMLINWRNYTKYSRKTRLKIRTINVLQKNDLSLKPHQS